MTIELKPEQQGVIERAIHSGVYRDAGEVISAALEMLSRNSTRKCQAKKIPPLGIA